MKSHTGIEVKVVDWNDGQREVAIHLHDFNQMLTLNAEGARSLAFLLMECADFIEPPFSGDVELNPESDQESVSLFGPYEEETETEDSEDFEDEDEDLDADE